MKKVVRLLIVFAVAWWMVIAILELESESNRLSGSARNSPEAGFAGIHLLFSTIPKLLFFIIPAFLSGIYIGISHLKTSAMVELNAKDKLRVYGNIIVESVLGVLSVIQIVLWYVPLQQLIYPIIQLLDPYLGV